jgi:hypothetical protein
MPPMITASLASLGARIAYDQGGHLEQLSPPTPLKESAMMRTLFVPAYELCVVGDCPEHKVKSHPFGTQVSVKEPLAHKSIDESLGLMSLPPFH